MNEKRLVTLEEHFLDVAAIASNEITRKRAEWLPAKLKDPLTDLGEGRLRAMDENGITVQVLSASAPGADLLDGQEGIRFARQVNDRLVEVVRRAPGRFAGFAHLPMRSPEAAADELERAVSDLGFRGAMINGMTDGRFLDNACFAPILARAAKLGAPIYLHPNFPPQAVMDAYYADLPGFMGFILATGGYGWHAETAIHVLRLALSGTFERHPGLNMIVGHMGETIPFMLDRLDHCVVDIQGSDTSPSRIILERLYITTAGVFSTPAFLCALTTFGPDRILFSVDYPYSGLQQAVSWLDHIPVAPADKHKIMHGNADRLLRLAELS
jgi:predicted TIM-barrel fold metal-dependent hydrolase